MLYLLVAISCSLLVNRFRRRRLFLVATIGKWLELLNLIMSDQFGTGMDLMFMAWTIVGSQFEKTHDVKSSGYPQIVFIWLFNVSYAIAWNGLSVTYCLEILPFKLRAKGMAIKAISGMAFLVLGKYVLTYIGGNVRRLIILSTVTRIPLRGKDYHTNTTSVYSTRLAGPIIAAVPILNAEILSSAGYFWKYFLFTSSS